MDWGKKLKNIEKNSRFCGWPCRMADGKYLGKVGCVCMSGENGVGWFIGMRITLLAGVEG